MLMGPGGRRNSGGIILHFSRPVREFLAKFSLALLILFSLFIIFVSKIDSPFTRSVKITAMDTYSQIAKVVVIPFYTVTTLVADMGDYFFVVSKNQQLVKENEYLKRQIALLSRISAENSHLRSLLHFVDSKEYNFISAKIVGDASGPFLRSVLINAGTNDEVSEGFAVSSDNGLIGRVVEVGRHSSKVILLTDVNSRIPVISGISKQRSIMSGNNSEHPILMYLPKDTSLIEGEEVVSSGDGNLFPAGLPIGIVYKDQSGKFTVKPYVKWNNLENVSVIEIPDVVPNDINVDEDNDASEVDPGNIAD